MRLVCPLKGAHNCWPVSTSQSLTSPPLPEASVLPSGLKTNEFRLPVWARTVERSHPVAKSQSLMVLSQPPVAAVVPSGETATHDTWSECPLRVARCLPLCTSQSLTVRSPDPDRSVWPSGLNARKLWEPARRVAVLLPLVTSHNFTGSSRLR